ncbi:MAG: hypothetical protein C6Y20_14035 [Tagaea sp. CACIAM 22H2]|nr:hypothetical protein [Tagaea sp. CACIAM 22H2]
MPRGSAPSWRRTRRCLNPDAMHWHKRIAIAPNGASRRARSGPSTNARAGTKRAPPKLVARLGTGTGQDPEDPVDRHFTRHGSVGARTT